MEPQEIYDYLESLEGKDRYEIVLEIYNRYPLIACAYGIPLEDSEKTEFDVVLVDVGPNRMMVIKTVRDYFDCTRIGLKQAKDFVENLPRIIEECVSLETAKSIKEKFESVGAKVELR